MLRQLMDLNPNITNVVVYCNSPSLQYMVKKLLQNKAQCNSDTIYNIETAKELTMTLNSTLTSPFWGGKWFLDIDADKIGIGDLVKSFKTTSNYRLNVYWVTKYSVFKKIKELDVVKKNQVNVNFYYLGKLSYDGIMQLYGLYLGEEENELLNSSLLKYVAKTYNYDVQGVCDLFTLLKSGNEVKDKKDIVELIGVGGNSIDKFLIKVLTSNYNTERGLKMVTSARIKLLTDLSVTYSYSMIKRIMESNIDGLIEMKQLQMMGYTNKVKPKIPDSFDSKRIARLKRYEGILKDEISLPMLLNLKTALRRHNTFNDEEDLLLAIYEYILTKNKLGVEI